MKLVTFGDNAVVVMVLLGIPLILGTLIAIVFLGAMG